ncbi:MAG: hypothetical protein ABGZ17_23410 [Planctomycetaceae bacterium]
MIRWAVVVLVLFVCGCSDKSETQPQPEADVSAEKTPQAVPDVLAPAPTHRGPDVEDGFQGDRHPALAEQSLKMRVIRSAIGTGRGFAEGYFPREFRWPFEEFQVAVPERNYSAQDLSAFLPHTFGQPGQTWEVDPKRVARFFKQIHAGASLTLAAPGRRGGPNGVFGVLRAVSDTQFEILTRVHAEFVVAPGAYMTPSYFEGRMLIDRQNRRVESFSLAVPSDVSLNATLTVIVPREALIDIVHLDRLELQGGSPVGDKPQEWTREISLDEARRKLTANFYKLSEIQWVPSDVAVAVAQKQNRPILAIVLWGGLDNQSC